MDEDGYLKLVRKILDSGQLVEGRNGATLCTIGEPLKFNLRGNKLPLLTTKRVFWKTCLRELLWFLSGSTSNKTLNDNGVHIWDENASPEFLASRGLDYEDGDLGPIYGHQWRHFNAEYTTSGASYAGKGVDQIAALVAGLSDPASQSSRRHILSSWNPQQIHEMALPPCHVLSQFHVVGGELHCTMYQRSADVGLGLPFNIASYAFLTHILCRHCRLAPGELSIMIGNAHIYEEHIAQMRELLCREILPCPTLDVLRRASSLRDYTVADFSVRDYEYAEALPMRMVP
jgi:thymidylate synthase